MGSSSRVRPRLGLPDAADQIVAGAAGTLAERFAETYDGLYADHRSRLDALITAGYPLPPELRAPMELALARRFEVEIARRGPRGRSRAVHRCPTTSHARRGVPASSWRPRGAATTMSATLLEAVERAVERPTMTSARARRSGLLRLVRGLDLPLDLERPQELVFERCVPPAAPPCGSSAPRWDWRSSPIP